MPHPTILSSRSTTRTRAHSHSSASSVKTHSSPNTPALASKRGDIPSRQSTSIANLPSSHLMPEQSQPTTPTPRKGPRRKRRGGAQSSRQRAKASRTGRQVDSVGDDSTEQEPPSSDEEALLDLLGVTSRAPDVATSKSTPGVLHISKAQINKASSGSENGWRKKDVKTDESEAEKSATQLEAADKPNSPSPAARDPRGKNKPAEEDERGTSETEIQKKVNGRRTKGRAAQDLSSSPSVLPPKKQVSNLTATRPKASNPSQAMPISTQESETNLSNTFDTTSLSKSLPSGAFFAPSPLPQFSTKKNKGKPKREEIKTDESAVWDMPVQPGSAQALTWQQKMQSSTSTAAESPRRSNKSIPLSGSSSNSERKSRSRPTSSNPFQGAQPMSSSPLVSRSAHTRRRSLDAAIPVSAFDDTIPFHTGFNVNRAPQTPAKLPTIMHANTNLPIVQGVFPRVAGQKAPLKAPAANGGIKYAGPTFHNSPNAASLPKPDLEDF